MDIDKEFILKNRDFIFPVLVIMFYLFFYVLNYEPVINVIGLLLVIYVPGTLFIRMLFPVEDDLGILERVVLGLCMSLVIMPLFGFILVNTIGLTIHTVFSVIALFSLIFLVAAYFRVSR